MPRFFIHPEQVGEAICLTGEDSLHIAKSLRMGPGDEVTLCDGQGSDYRCVIQEVTKSQVLLQMLEKMQNRSEPQIQITLFQALPKGDKLDLIVQKAVELGASQIVPVLTSRCISRPDEKSMERKIDRLQKIALEAAKQSQRGMVPSIGPLLNYEKALDVMHLAEKAILFYENESRPLRELLVPMPRSIALLVGSEGGFSEEEVALARQKGIAIASLGTRILRCETAPIAGLAAVLFAAGEF